MQTPVLLALLITVLPLAAWLVEFLHAAVTRRIPIWADKLSTVAIFASLGLALYLFFSEGVCFGGGISEPYMASWTWFRLGSEGMASSFVMSFDVTVDNLTCVMFVVVTLVAALVHLYSRGYMHGEDRYPRFFFYLSLFSFSMLGLCTTSNLAMLFIFWELVGVCSYFLIGFYFFKKSAADASKKAFVTNRIGDAGFMAGIFLILSVLSSYQAPIQDAEVEKLSDGGYAVRVDGERHLVGPGTRFSVREEAGGGVQVLESWGGSNVLSFQRIWESIAYLQTPEEGGGEHDRGPWGGREGLLVLAGLLVFMGCVTKSAQFPLHVWLPDAMEGPTPVSALIHAATMVAAGVYMVCRMFPLLAGEGYMVGDYASSPALWVIAGVGAVTAIFAGTIALAQTDLKKGLAYSTCSQLGYMVMAVGVGSATAAMFHLFTHAFFKACLFLCAGSVIHAVHSQELSDMGGLRKKMPITYAAFGISCLAISGVPFFSGFLSKESVLGQGAAFGLYHGSLLAWMPFALCAITAILTALYMFRLFFLTFWGTPGDQKRYDHAHESPPSMAVPLMVLATLAVFSAGIAVPLVAGYTGGNWFPSAVNEEVLVKTPMQNLASTETARELFATQQVVNPLAHEESPAWSEPVRHFWHALHETHYWVFGFSLLAAFGGIGLAFFFFVKRRGVDFVGQIKPLARYREVLVNLYYVDWFYTFRVVPTVKDLTSLAWWSDKKLVDGAVHLFAWTGRAFSWVSGRIDALGVDGLVRGSGWLMMKMGNGLRRLVTGKIEDYVQYTVVGMGVFLLILILAS